MHVSHDEGIAADVLSSWYGKELLKRFADPAEAVRAAAIAAYLAAVQAGPNAVLPLLPYTIPVLEERLERHEQHVLEPSEDVRLALLRVRPLSPVCGACSRPGDLLYQVFVASVPDVCTPT